MRLRYVVPVLAVNGALLLLLLYFFLLQPRHER
jgi:hypothetical protein